MEKIYYGKNWDAMIAYAGDDAKKLLAEGWEPYAVHKGDFTIWGFSLGWAFAPTLYFFKRPHQGNLTI